MQDLIFSLNATVPIFLIMLLGYALFHFNIIDAPFVKTLNKFSFNVTLPILLFHDISTANFYEVWDGRYILYCFLVSLFCIICVWGITSLVYKDKKFLGEFVQASYRGSAAVLGIAFVQSIYGTSAIAPLMVIGTVPLYNVMAVSILSFTRPTAEQVTVKKKEQFIASLKGIITNPIIIGIGVGILVSILRIQMPTIVVKTMGSLSDLATPLALIALGAGFEGKKVLAKIKPTLVASFIKLLLQPFLFLPLAIYFGFTDEKLVAILIMLGAPTTVSCYIMAKNMQHSGTLSSSIIVTTTFLSSISLTFWLFLLRQLGYI